MQGKVYLGILSITGVVFTFSNLQRLVGSFTFFFIQNDKCLPLMYGTVKAIVKI